MVDTNRFQAVPRKTRMFHFFTLHPVESKTNRCWKPGRRGQKTW